MRDIHQLRALPNVPWRYLLGTPDKIYYANTKADAAAIGFDDKFIYDELELPVDKRKLSMVQLMRDDALGVFKLWSEAENKREY